mgnify:CR=1 FL=1
MRSTIVGWPRCCWKPPGPTSLSRIEITMDLSHHGGSKGKIECDVLAIYGEGIAGGDGSDRRGTGGFIWCP